MADIAAELAELRAQMNALMGTAEGGLEVQSIWIVFNPNKRATWCHKSDCPMLGRKVTYDVVKEGEHENDEGDLEDIIMQGVTEEDSNAPDVKQKVKRVGSPTVKLDPLGVVSAFTTKAKALDFIEEYFKLNQDSSPQDLQMTEVKIIS